MEAKEKAKELVKKHLKFAHITDDDYVLNGAENHYYNAKNCALISVEEIMNEYPCQNTFYWSLVKEEIQNL